MQATFSGGSAGATVSNPVTTAQGGLGANNSAATGIAQMSAGVASISDTLTRAVTLSNKLIFNADIAVGNENAVGQQSGVLTLGSGGGGPIQFRHTGTGTATLGTSGLTMSVPILLPSSVAGVNSAVWLGKDANGPAVNVGAAGGGGNLQIFSGGSLNTGFNETYGIGFYTNQTVAGASSSDQICRTAGGLNVNAHNTGSVYIKSGGTTLAEFAASGTTYVGTLSAGGDLITPAAAFAIRSPGVAFTNDGAWTNIYSLAAGTHNGRFIISCALFGGWAIFTVNGTSIALVTDEWGFADVTAAAGKIAFRISAGWLQYNCGTSISSTPKFMHVDFIGVAR